MKKIQSILLMAILLSPALSLAGDNHRERSQRYDQWWSYNNTQAPNSNGYGYDERYDKRKPHNKTIKNQNNKQKRTNRKIVKSGWNVDPRIAQQSPHCHHYTLSTYGGKGSARITSIAGKNYIQVDGQRSGYVCFQGNPTLELGKLGNPNIKVKFNLEGSGNYGFGRGQTGANYKNNWYRSYWGI